MAVLLCCYKLSSLSSEVHAMAGHLPDSARYRTEQVEELKVDWLFLKNSKDSSVSQSIPWLSASLGCLWWSLSYNVYFKVSVYDFPCDFSGTYISVLHIYLLTLPEMGLGVRENGQGQLIRVPRWMKCKELARESLPASDLTFAFLSQWSLFSPKLDVP